MLLNITEEYNYICPSQDSVTPIDSHLGYINVSSPGYPLSYSNFSDAIFHYRNKALGQPLTVNLWDLDVEIKKMNLCILHS